MLFGRKSKYVEKKRSPTTSFLAGSAAGLAVDVGLFPLDTLKTRLQSQYGFWKSGGFRGIYKGLAPTAIGSAPCGAIFFVTYNRLKYACEPYTKVGQEPFAHIFSASIAEWTCCIVRVPTEIVKQRQQAGLKESKAFKIISSAYRQEGIRGFFNGFWMTVLRDVPYAIVQFPLWEYFKYSLSTYMGEPITALQGAFCGALAGGIAGAVTTPLDVIKTQIMLSNGERRQIAARRIVKNIYTTRGFKGFLAGFVPRVTWIFLGGFIFFGVYEETCLLIDGDGGIKKRDRFS